jgi:predicted RNA-binding protein with PUA-like domain
VKYWLFKSEPSTWSWQQQVDKGAPEQWDGVRNYQARNNMREMKVGDLGFFYHSMKEKSIVGIVRVAKEAHQDSTTDDNRWQCVDVEAVEPVPQPVTLEMVKNDPRLSNMALVTQSRLSVQPVTPEEWQIIREMAGF